MSTTALTYERFEEEVLTSLNAEQRVAVDHLTGPMLVLAGAGSGKTRVLTVRIANLVLKGEVRPHEVLALTFTNKAAREMRERIEGMLGADPRGMFVGTFHGFGARLLRHHGGAMGWSQNFTILDSDQTLRVVKRILKEHHLDPEEFDPRAVRNAIGDAKNAFLSAGEVENKAIATNDTWLKVAAAVYRAYAADLSDQNAVDFDDLIVRPVDLLESCPEIRDEYRRRFRQILVDEYQDTNLVQVRLLMNLTDPDAPNITVVGDDDQSIYRFRGADLRNILEFESQFETARVVKLEQNYRSTATILAAANAVIANNTQRKGKTLRAVGPDGDRITVREAESDVDEARWVVDEIERVVARNGRPYRDFAILYRTNAQSRVLEEMFRRRNVPHRILGGMRFFDRREIMDTMAYMRLVSNPDERQAFERAVNWPKRGIGKTSMERLFDFARRERLTLLQAAEEAERAGDIPKNAVRGLHGFASLIREHAEIAETHSVADVLRSIVERAEILETLRGEKDGGEDRADNVEELLNAASEFDPAEFARDMVPGMNETDFFVQHVALLSDVDSDDPDADAVVMMTLHSAKGLEFPVVFIVGLEDGLFPHARSKWSADDMEEERRLFYVGVTRAMQKLYFCHATSRRRAGEMIFSQPSMFIGEVPEAFLHTDNTFHW